MCYLEICIVLIKVELLLDSDIDHADGSVLVKAFMNQDQLLVSLQWSQHG